MSKGRNQTIGESESQSNNRQWVIWLSCAVVLAVSLLSCVTYIALMSKAFPDGLFRVACYIGAMANLMLMVVLLGGKFVWIRPGTSQSKIAWLVTFLEIAIASLNLMLAYALQHGDVTGLLNLWFTVAPMSPVFSMIGAILLIMSSSDMKRRHVELTTQEEIHVSQQQIKLQEHRANMTIQSTYIDYIEAAMIKRLNSVQVLETIDRNADATVAYVIASMSGMSPVAIPERTADITHTAFLAQHETVPKSIDTHSAFASTSREERDTESVVACPLKSIDTSAEKDVKKQAKK